MSRSKLSFRYFREYHLIIPVIVIYEELRLRTPANTALLCCILLFINVDLNPRDKSTVISYSYPVVADSVTLRVYHLVTLIAISEIVSVTTIFYYNPVLMPNLELLVSYPKPLIPLSACYSNTRIETADFVTTKLLYPYQPVTLMPILDLYLLLPQNSNTVYICDALSPKL